MDSCQASAATTAAQTVTDKFANNANEALALLIIKVTSGINQASDFLVAQVPDVIHQLLVYNLVVNLICWTISLSLMITFPLAFRRLYKKYKEDLPLSSPTRFDRQNLAALTSIGAIFGFMISAIVFAVHWDWIKIWLAPKIWLIEYSVSLVKTASGH